MPLYQFQCEKCERVFESIAKLGESNPPCSECGAPSEKLLTAPGGYHIRGDNGASQRPRGAGSFRKGK